MSVNISPKTAVALRRTCILAVSLMVLVFIRTSNSQQVAVTQWTITGNDITNSRSQVAERIIGTANAASLATKWVATTGGDVSATPTVDATSVYVPDWAGNLYALHRDTGSVIWSRKISDYNGVAGSVS